MSKTTLRGFDGSTYVRTVKMLLSEKQFADFEQVPANVLAGEPRYRRPLLVRPAVGQREDGRATGAGPHRTVWAERAHHRPGHPVPPMNGPNKLPGFQRSRPGLEWAICKRLPAVLAGGTALPLLVAALLWLPVRDLRA